MNTWGSSGGYHVRTVREVNRTEFEENCMALMNAGWLKSEWGWQGNTVHGGYWWAIFVKREGE